MMYGNIFCMLARNVPGHHPTIPVYPDHASGLARLAAVRASATSARRARFRIRPASSGSDHSLLTPGSRRLRQLQEGTADGIERCMPARKRVIGLRAMPAVHDTGRGVRAVAPESGRKQVTGLPA